MKYFLNLLLTSLSYRAVLQHRQVYADSLAREIVYCLKKIIAVLNFVLLLPTHSLYTVNNMLHILYIHTSDCLETVYELPPLTNNNALEHFYTNQKR